MRWIRIRGRAGRLVAVAVGAVVVLGLAACSSRDDPDVTTTTTDDPDAERKAEIAAAYEAQWDAYREIFADPDPANPLIAPTYTGEALDNALG